MFLFQKRKGAIREDSSLINQKIYRIMIQRARDSENIKLLQR